MVLNIDVHIYINKKSSNKRSKVSKLGGFEITCNMNEWYRVTHEKTLS